MCKVFPLLRRVKRDTYCILVGDFEVRVRVRRVIRQKAHVRAKCVRGKTSKCGVRACDGKFVALQHSANSFGRTNDILVLGHMGQNVFITFHIFKRQTYL